MYLVRGGDKIFVVNVSGGMEPKAKDSSDTVISLTERVRFVIM